MVGKKNNNNAVIIVMIMVKYSKDRVHDIAKERRAKNILT